MSTPHPAVAALAGVVGEQNILHDPDEMLVYECDGFPIAKGLPLAVVFPTETPHVAECVRVLAEHDLQIVPRGSGTGLAGGSVAFGGEGDAPRGVILSTSRMTRIEWIDLANRCALVQAGVRNTALTGAVQAYRDAQGRTGRRLHFSPDPSSQRASTIGGNAATNAGGINTLKHGVTTNHVLGVEVVLADGSICDSRTAPLHDGVGPDLPGLFCGSEGVLGVITRVLCRLTPRPEHFRTMYAVFDDSRDACQVVSDVTAVGIVPASMEMLDGAMVKVVEDAFHYGFPTTAQAMLLIEIDGVDATLDEQLRKVVDICHRNNATGVQSCSDPQRRAELWSARKRAFGAIGRISRSYCTQDACIPRSKLPEAIVEIGRIGQRFGLKIPNVFHAGDGNVHPILLFDEDDPAQVQNTLAASEAILEHCVSIGGTITGEHGVGVEKIHLMRKMFSPDTIDTFQRIKSVLDPQHRINDGKLVPSETLRIDLLRPVAPNTPGGAM